MASRQGPAYERWGQGIQPKQMAAALQYLQEHHLTDYAALTARTEAAVITTRCLTSPHNGGGPFKPELMAATVISRPARCSMGTMRYSAFAQHEAELATYRAAKTP